MAFRDDSVAAHARADSLERELARAREELGQLRALEPVAAPARMSGAARAAIAWLASALALFGAAFFSGFVVSGRAAEIVGIGLGAGGALVLCLAVALTAIAHLVVVVPPNQLAVLSGRRHQEPDGSVVGFRILRGGRAIRMPVIESLHFMDLTNLPLVFEVRNCQARTGALVLKVVANVKVASEMPLVLNAVERFLSRSRADIAEVASQTLEGTLRGVVASFTVEEVRSDRVRVAAAVLEEAEADMSKLGLVVDTLTIQDVGAA